MINEGWSLGTVTGHRVIQAGERSLGFSGANSNHGRVISRGLNGGVTVSTVTVITTGVAGRHHYHNACFPGGFHRLAYRVKRITLKYLASERKIDDPDVVSIFELDGPLNSGNHLAIVASAVRRQHPQIDDVGVGSDTGVLLGIVALRVASVPGDDAGHMRPMPVTIGSAGVAGNKTLAVHDAGTGAAGFLQVIMAGDAAINDRNADPRAIERILLPGDISQHCGGRVVEGGGIRPVGRDISDIVMGFQKGQQLRGNAEGRSLDVRKIELQPAAAIRHHLKMPGLRGPLELDDHVHRAIRIQREISHIGRQLVPVAFSRSGEDRR